jgi:hypothetical protein
MSIEQMKETLLKHGRPLQSFKAGDEITVSNKMRKGYKYTLAVDPGSQFHPEFKPYATPGEMLAMGAFEGKYLNDCITEFPAEWFWNAIQADKLRPQGADVSVNLLGVDSRQPLQFWIDSGWVPGGSGSIQSFQILRLIQMSADGSNGTVATGWVVAYPCLTLFRSNDGRHLQDMLVRSRRTVSLVTLNVALDRDRDSFNGHTILSYN